MTSLPDHSEIPALGVDGWRAWFVDTVALACRQVADDAVAVFFQTDVKHDGRWIDKGHLVHLGIDAAGSHLLWHKVVCRVRPGQTTFGRPAYAHMLCASRGLKLSAGASTPDVLPELGDDALVARDGHRRVRAAGRSSCSRTPRVGRSSIRSAGTARCSSSPPRVGSMRSASSCRRVARARPAPRSRA